MSGSVNATWYLFTSNVLLLVGMLRYIVNGITDLEEMPVYESV